MINTRSNMNVIMRIFTLLVIVLPLIFSGCKKSFQEKVVVCDTIPDGGVNPDAEPYNLVIPPFFPAMDIPTGNQLTVENVELGRHLFWDVRLSGDNTQACATCHIPENGFADPEQFSTGITGAVGDRQAMSCQNLGWASNFFWDGRAFSLEDQVVAPVDNPIEMNQNWDELLIELAETDIYPEMYNAAFGTIDITKERSGRALASFLRTMISGNAKFDKQRLGQYTYTESEAHGYNLFITEGGDPDNGQGGAWGADCFHCHNFGASQFSDYLPHNNGLDSVFTDLGVGGNNGNSSDYGKFKTPTLRNIELTAPYMHDGRFNTLEEVIDHYNSGGQPSATIDSFMKYTDGGLQLSDQSKEDLINFLKCLTDTTFVNNPAFGNPF